MTDPTLFHVYIDESSQTGHAYMVVGALVCIGEAVSDITGVMNRSLQRHGARDDTELHWNELSRHTLPLYKDVLTALVGFTQTHPKVTYRALVVDMLRLDQAKTISGHRDREMKLAKSIFALVFAVSGPCQPKRNYHVWIDKRPDSVHDLEMDQRILQTLNTIAMLKFALDAGPFVAVEFIDSRKNRLIQAADVLTGAVAYETNQKHLAHDASKHRVALLQHVITCSTLPTLAMESLEEPLGFQILHSQPS